MAEKQQPPPDKDKDKGIDAITNPMSGLSLLRSPMDWESTRPTYAAPHALPPNLLRTPSSLTSPSSGFCKEGGCTDVEIDKGKCLQDLAAMQKICDDAPDPSSSDSDLDDHKPSREKKKPASSPPSHPSSSRWGSGLKSRIALWKKARREARKRATEERKRRKAVRATLERRKRAKPAVPAGYVPVRCKECDREISHTAPQQLLRQTCGPCWNRDQAKKMRLLVKAKAESTPGYQAGKKVVEEANGLIRKEAFEKRVETRVFDVSQMAGRRLDKLEDIRHERIEIREWTVESLQELEQRVKEWKQRHEPSQP